MRRLFRNGHFTGKEMGERKCIGGSSSRRGRIIWRIQHHHHLLHTHNNFKEGTCRQQHAQGFKLHHPFTPPSPPCSYIWATPRPAPTPLLKVRPSWTAKLKASPGHFWGFIIEEMFSRLFASSQQSPPDAIRPFFHFLGPGFLFSVRLSLFTSPLFFSSLLMCSHFVCWFPEDLNWVFQGEIVL